MVLVDAMAEGILLHSGRDLRRMVGIPDHSGMVFPHWSGVVPRGTKRICALE